MNELWKIELLGGLRATHGGRTIARFPTRRTAALLAYLALDLDRRHSREALGALLWPEATPAARQEHLSVALAWLRGVLEPPGVPAGTVLRADRLSVQLNPAAVTTDAAGLPAEGFRHARFQPARCPEPTGEGFPALRAPFVGRRTEIALLQEILAPPDGKKAGVRLVTLTGSGGVGKTRLAVEIAGRLREAWQGHVQFVPLAGRSRSHSLLVAAAEALAPLPCLLILDGFEPRSPEEAALLGTLLARLPGLTCLVTARRRVGISGERAFAVAPLRGGESVRLFIERAGAACADLCMTAEDVPAAAELCRRLEGVPLGVELVAAHARWLSPEEMLVQLRSRFELLSRLRAGAERRRRALRCAMDWSVQMLSPDLGRFFARLGLFPGAWTVEAAEAVGETPLALDRLAQLCDLALILPPERVSDDSSPLRFRLPEALREYARDQLTLRERAEAECRHAGYLVALGEEISF